jgi:hypothetical protein
MATLTSNSLDNCNSIPDFIPAGTRMTFNNTSAPTSWTKDTTSYNNRALRLVTGTATPGGTTAFTSVFPGTQRPVGGSINAANSAATFGQTTISVSIGAVNSFPTWSIQATTISEPLMSSHTHTNQRHVRQSTNSAPQTGGVNMLKAPVETAFFDQSGGGGSHSHSKPAGGNHDHTAPVTAHGHPLSSSGPHPHGFTAPAQDFAIAYVDVITCSKN